MLYCITEVFQFEQPAGNAGGRISQGVIGWSADDSADPSPQTPTRRRRRALTSTTPIDAIAVLSSIAGSGVIGTIYFRQNDGASPLLVAYNVSGLAPNATVGIRILTLGDITNPAGPSTDAAAIYPATNPCGTNLTTNSLGVTADESGRVSALPLSASVLSIPGLSIYPDSPNSILGRGLALHFGGSDCTASLAVTYFLAQAVIGIRNGTVAPSFNPPSLATTTAYFPATSTAETTSLAFTRNSGALAGFMPSLVSIIMGSMVVIGGYFAF
ncbi:hypothetical protein BC829DRAFT_403054 [Chytridium lagenaria]|nr:hypothetical protein BC829DRAFT_403054 [Chytridium lagenaria]